MKFLLTLAAVFAWRLLAEKVLGMQNGLASIIGILIGTAVFLWVSSLKSRHD